MDTTTVVITYSRVRAGLEVLGCCVFEDQCLPSFCACRSGPRERSIRASIPLHYMAACPVLYLATSLVRLGA